MSADINSFDRRLFMVVGVQRTGTTLLRDILNSNKNVIMVAEVMIPYADTCHWNHFAATVPAADLRPADEAAGLALFDRYFDYLHEQIRAKWNGPCKRDAFAFGVDIKCDQLRQIQPIGWPNSAPPFLLHYARIRRTALINTTRRNVLQCAISILIATQRNFWHNYEGREFGTSYELNIGECLYLSRALVDQQQEFERFTKECSVTTCFYEDLVEAVSAAGPDGDLSSNPGPLKNIAETLAISCCFRFDGRLHRAINRPYSEIISNHRELVAAIRASELARFAKTIV